MTCDRSHWLDFCRRCLEYRRLPALLALGAMLLMVPALGTGLFMDDLVQRAVELKPDQMPPRLYDAGVPADSGSLRTVVADLFPGVGHDAESLARAKRYGVLPWWTPDDMRVHLWRPLTAITHWIDYRLFPDSPGLMHAENIVWFAAVVFLATMLYRKFMGPGWVAGVAAVLFLLDGNTYFPVMFVANRGFVISLCLGLLCVYGHHQWRTANSRTGGVLAPVALAAALFANEGGASTLAFILAYALVLDAGSWRRRAVTMLPSMVAVFGWRTIYKLGGFGIFHVGLYIDPANEPLAFAGAVVPRGIALLGGQFAGVAPDFLFALKPSACPAVIGLYGLIVIAVLAVAVPWLRRDKTAAFWLAVTVLAAIPAATVEPLSKNMGFMAFGAYGLIASFFGGLVNRSGRLPSGRAYRIAAWMVWVPLLVAHVAGDVAGRILEAKIIPRVVHLQPMPNLLDEDMVIVNGPAFTTVYGPFVRAYEHLPLPATQRTLVPGCTSYEVERVDDKTLVVRSRVGNIFSCPELGLFSVAYVCQRCNSALGQPRCRKGDRQDLGGLQVEVLEADAAGLASKVEFHFDRPLESSSFRWLQFDWRTYSCVPFRVPEIGRSATLAGPGPR